MTNDTPTILVYVVYREQIKRKGQTWQRENIAVFLTHKAASKFADIDDDYYVDSVQLLG